MSELEYRVVFKDDTYGRWYLRQGKDLGEVIKLRLELDAPGAVLRVEFRAPEDPHCSRCDLAVEDLGLCFEHLNEELDAYNYDDPWPDFNAPLGEFWF